MPKRAAFERSRRELSLGVPVGVHVLLVVEQSSLESQFRGCAKTPILTVYHKYHKYHKYLYLHIFLRSLRSGEECIRSPFGAIHVQLQYSCVPPPEAFSSPSRLYDHNL